MNLPSPKELKQLAAACRKAGISHFKSGDFEFTLGPQPAKQAKAGDVPKVNHDDGKEPEVEDALSAEDLMFWSASGGMPIATSEKQG